MSRSTLQHDAGLRRHLRRECLAGACGIEAYSPRSSRADRSREAGNRGTDASAGVPLSDEHRGGRKGNRWLSRCPAPAIDALARVPVRKRVGGPESVPIEGAGLKIGAWIAFLQ
jgi:hypothetical protein